MIRTSLINGIFLFFTFSCTTKNETHQIAKKVNKSCNIGISGGRSLFAENCTACHAFDEVTSDTIPSIQSIRKKEQYTWNMIIHKHEYLIEYLEELDSCQVHYLLKALYEEEKSPLTIR